MKKNILIIGLLIIFSACRKDNTTFDGPSIEDQYSSFKWVQSFKASADSINFETQNSMYFKAEFNKSVNWTIKIKGLSSGAEKTIDGFSRKIDETNSVWNGSTTVFPMFKNENCSVVLKIKNEADSMIVAVKVIKPKINQGLVIADFENGFDSKWTKFVQTGANMDWSIKTTNAPQSNKFLRMSGTVNWDWLVGLIDFNASAYTTTGNVIPLGSNPDKTYFNCLIFGVSNTNLSKILFQFKEDENSNGTFDPNTEDQYDFLLDVNWVGWKLISVKYSDVKTLVNGQPATPKGNGQHNPDRIGKISMLQLADPAQGYADCSIDYIIISENPLDI